MRASYIDVVRAREALAEGTLAAETGDVSGDTWLMLACYDLDAGEQK